MWPQIDPESPRPGSRLLASWIERDVSGGVLAPGERLPAQREIARRLGIAIGTVTRAFALARRQGWIVTRVGDGSYVRGGSPSERRADEVVDFSRNDPIFVREEREALADSLRGLARRAGDLDLCVRDPDRSLLERLGRAGAAFLAEKGWEPRSSSGAGIVACASTQHALLVACGSLLSPGDALLCESLVFPGVRGLAQRLGIELIPIESDDAGPRPDALDRACSARRARAFYTTPTLHPITGQVVSEERRRQLIDVARRRDLMVIEDVDDGLLLPEPPPSFASLAPERALLLAETSKGFWSGGRLTLVVAPNDLRPELETGVRSTLWSIPTLPSLVAAEWMEDGTADRLVRLRRSEIRARRDVLQAALAPLTLRGEDAAPHLWLPLSASFPVATAVDRARGQGVPVTDAEPFRMPGSPAPTGLRLCLAAAPAGERLREASRRLARLLESRITISADSY